MLAATASAPAKLVLSGEYAVLFGAPALVLAIDRAVDVRITPREDAMWSLAAPGFSDDAELFSVESGAIRFATDAASKRWQLAGAVLAAAGLTDESGADIVIDSRALYSDGRKLGLGSSAAVCVALGRALNKAAGASFDMASLAALHRDLQGGRGSGVDVAAAWCGGFSAVTRTDAALDVAAMNGSSQAVLSLVDTGVASATGAMLARLSAWHASAADADVAIAALCAAASAAVARWQSGAAQQAIAGYALALAEFDRASELGILSAEHRALAAIAASTGVAYKPSGAGGGDIGIAAADDAADLAAFDAAARAAGFSVWPVAASASLAA